MQKKLGAFCELAQAVPKSQGIDRNTGGTHNYDGREICGVQSRRILGIIKTKGLMIWQIQRHPKYCEPCIISAEIAAEHQFQLQLPPASLYRYGRGTSRRRHRLRIRTVPFLLDVKVKAHSLTSLKVARTRPLTLIEYPSLVKAGFEPLPLRDNGWHHCLFFWVARTRPLTLIEYLSLVKAGFEPRPLRDTGV
eukprot:g75404.t1